MNRDDVKQLVQRKIRQLVFLNASYVQDTYAVIPVDQEKEYRRIYADYQAGLVSMADIEADTQEYLKLRKLKEI